MVVFLNPLSFPVGERKRLSEEVSMLRALVKETRSSDNTVTARPTMTEHGCQTVAPSPPALAAPTPAEPSLEKDVEELKTQLVCLVLCCVVLAPAPLPATTATHDTQRHERKRSTALVTAYRKATSQRRRLHNQLQELRGTKRAGCYVTMSTRASPQLPTHPPHFQAIFESCVG